MQFKYLPACVYESLHDPWFIDSVNIEKGRVSEI
jgi:hypothetical protein